MGEKLNKLIEKYESSSADALKKANEKFNTYRSLKSKIESSNESLDLPEYPTVGAFVAALFPEKGGVDRDLFQNIYPKLEISDENQVLIKSLFKVANAPLSLQKATSFQEQGALVYFNKIKNQLVQAVQSAKSLGTNISIDEVLGKGSQLPDDEKIENFLDSLAYLVPEVGLLSPPEVMGPNLYEAMVESFKNETSQVMTPINEEKASEVAPVAEGSALNPSETSLGEETETVSGLGQVTSSVPEVPTELPEKETIPININLEQVTSEGTPVSSLAPPNTLNQEVNTFSEILESSTNVFQSPASEGLPLEVTSAPTAAVRLPVIEPSVFSQINDLFTTGTSFIESPKISSNVISQAFLENFTQLGKKEILEKEVESVESQSLNLVEKEKSTIESITESFQAALPNFNVEPGTQSLVSEKETIFSSINERQRAFPIFQEMKKFMPALQVGEQLGINLGNFFKNRKKTNEAVTAATQEKISAEETALSNQMEISKTLQQIPIETRKAETFTQTLMPSPVESSQVTPEPAVKESAFSSIENASKPVSPSSAQAASTMLNLESLENRLMRIEYILSNTLEVKIVD